MSYFQKLVMKATTNWQILKDWGIPIFEGITGSFHISYVIMMEVQTID